MYEFGNFCEFKRRATYRFENPQNYYSRNADRFERPPRPLLRRPMMCGRYPNIGYRHFAQPFCRPFRMPPGQLLGTVSPLPPRFNSPKMSTTHRINYSQDPEISNFGSKDCNLRNKRGSFLKPNKNKKDLKTFGPKQICECIDLTSPKRESPDGISDSKIPLCSSGSTELITCFSNITEDTLRTDSKMVNHETQYANQHSDEDNFHSLNTSNLNANCSVADSKMSLCSADNTELVTVHSKNIEDTVEINSKLLEHQTQVSNQHPAEDNSHTVNSHSSLNPAKVEDSTDKSRPVSFTTVQGTCWGVVWTGDERVFFYDHTRKVSVWDRPNELLNRCDVDKLVDKPISLNHEKPENSTSADAKKMEKDSGFSGGLKESTSCANGVTNIKEHPNVNISHEEKIKNFTQMLEEKNVSAFSTWEKELHKIIPDPRYQLLCSLKERRQVFDCYVSGKMEDEKRDRLNELNLKKENFRILLKEAGVNSKTFFGDFVKRCGKDVRFKAIEKLKKKENMFYEYVSEIIIKEKDDENRKMEQEKNFIKLLSEQNLLNKDTTWPEIEKIISNHESYKAIQSKRLREKIFRKYMFFHNRNLSSSIERTERACTSILNREEEVKRDLSVCLRDRELEQELHGHKVSVSDFKALLNDLIVDADTSWYAARKMLKEDHRWNFSQCLNLGKRKELFNEHIDCLNRKKIERFHLLLDDIPSITLKSSWLDVREDVLSDRRCSDFSSSEKKCKLEFKEYLRRKYRMAKGDFKELLRETKVITWKSKGLLNETNHLRDIEAILSKDKRYLVLKDMHGECRKMLLSYIDQLDAKGPQRHLTACSPSKRSHKTQTY